MKGITVFAVISAFFVASAVARPWPLDCQLNLGSPCGDSSKPREQNCCIQGYCQPWNSGYYQCLAVPAKCPTQETDIDYYGNDLKAIYGLQPDKCCDECAKTTDCVAYTFVNENPDGKTACYLKKSTAGRVEKKGAVSGTLLVTPPPTDCPVQEKDIDYYGNDLKTVFGGSNSDCCDSCGTTTNCIAYTYIEATKACYLKSSTAGKVAKTGAISAQRKVVPPNSCPTQEIDTDYYGNDIANYDGLTNGECCDKCAALELCLAYTYIEKGGDGKSACYLKNSADGKTTIVGHVSGKFREIPPPHSCPTQDLDTDYYGNDIKKVTGVSTAQCCDECAKTAYCTAYTYIAKDATCYLKKSDAGKVAKPGAVSAKLTCSTPIGGECGSSKKGPSCCPSGSFCQPWDPLYYQCIPVLDPAKCPTVVTGVDYYGGDLEVQYNLVPATCCDACFNNADCHYFTYIAAVDGNPSTCYLKSKLVEQRANERATSGAKA